MNFRPHLQRFPVPNAASPLSRGLLLFDGYWLNGVGAALYPDYPWTYGGMCHETNMVSGATLPNLFATGEATIACWVRTTNTNGAWDNGFLTIGHQTTTFRDFLTIKRYSWEPYAQARVSQAYTAVTTGLGTRTINDNRWHLIHAVVRGTQLECWVDGSLDTQVAHGLTFTNANMHWEVAKEGGTAMPMAWSRALSPAEIRSMYAPETRFALYTPLSRRRVFAALAAAGVGGVTYDEAITIAAATTQAMGRTVSMQGSIGLTAGVAVGESASAAMTAATTLSAVAAYTPSVTSTVLGAMALDATTGLTPSVTAVVMGAVTLDAVTRLTPAVVASMAAQVALTGSTALTPAATLVAQATALVTAAATLSLTSGSQSYDVSMSLGAQAGLVTQSLHAMVASMGLDATTALSADRALTTGAAVAISAQAAIDHAATQLHATAVALQGTTGVQAATVAEYQRSLSLSVAAVLAAAGSIVGSPTYTVIRVAAETLRRTATSNETLRQTTGTDALGSASASDEELV